MKMQQKRIIIFSILLLITILPLTLKAQEITKQQTLDDSVRIFLEKHKYQWVDMNIPMRDGELLYDLIIENKYTQALEIGTSTGHSTIWIAWALSKTGGKLITHEIDSARAAEARDNFKKASVDDLITVVEGNAHETVKQQKDPIDILFLDADKEGYVDYLDKLLPLIRPGGLIIAHNMNTRQADQKYVEAITTSPELETLLLLREGTGVGVTLKKR